MTAAVPEIFISYAHDDNEYPRYTSPDWEGSRGWVECFYHALRRRVQQLRRGTEIWRDGDGRIRGASALTPAVEDGISSASILVTINSPAYAASEWCERELKFFVDSATQRHGGLRVGTMLRVFRIDKFWAPGDSFIKNVPELKGNPGYPFFRYVDGSPLEFEPQLAGEPGPKFLTAITALACDIVRVLQGRAAIVPASGINVYLAETTPDAVDLRSKLQGELEQYGHSVLTHRSDTRGPDYSAQVRAQMQRCRLSVHVVGATTGTAPDPADPRTDVAIQYDVAGDEAARRSAFTRLTWLAPAGQTIEPAAAAFRERLQATDPALLVAPIEDVRTQIKLLLEAKPPHPKPNPERDVRIVYVIFDAPDEESARPITKWLEDQGFEVLKPARSGNLLLAHKVNLRDSHGALIYYGQVNDDWLAVKLGDLRKRLGGTRANPHKLLGAVYLADPDDDIKADFRSRLFDVIPGFGSFRPETLAEFVGKVSGSIDS
jgi:hypothetical protein